MKLYSNLKFLYFCIFMAIICMIASIVMHIIDDNFSFMDIGGCVITIVLLFWIAYAYKFRQKDVLKGLVTSILSMYFIYYLACLDFIKLSKTSWVFDFDFAVAWMLINAFVFILHMMINVTNEPSERLVRINTFFISLLSIMMFCIVVYILVDNVEEYHNWVIPSIGIIFVYNTIICIEGRIEQHREIRSKSVKK